MRKLIIFVVLIAVVLVAGTAKAAEYTLNPAVSGWTEKGGMGFTGPELRVGKGWRIPEATSWLKYNIPEYPGEVITEVLLNIDVKVQTNGDFVAGIRLTYVSDDSWTKATITSDWPVSKTMALNRRWSNSGKNGLGLISSDITSWLWLPSEKEGGTLSICLTRFGLGIRGALIVVKPTLTIKTE